jgi:hypothetical protein
MSQVAGSDGLASSAVESGDPADSGSFMSPRLAWAETAARSAPSLLGLRVFTDWLWVGARRS